MNQKRKIASILIISVVILVSGCVNDEVSLSVSEIKSESVELSDFTCEKSPKPLDAAEKYKGEIVHYRGKLKSISGNSLEIFAETCRSVDKNNGRMSRGYGGPNIVIRNVEPSKIDYSSFSYFFKMWEEHGSLSTDKSWNENNFSLKDNEYLLRDRPISVYGRMEGVEEVEFHVPNTNIKKWEERPVMEALWIESACKKSFDKESILFDEYCAP